MASTIPEPGFLTRIVQHIRAATQDVLQGEGTPVSEFVAPRPDASNTDSARRLSGQNQKLKDDTIRRREFDYLRKVRTLRLRDDPENWNKLSAFQNSSILNLDGQSRKERAGTVHKINAIEAELVQQWWTDSDAEGAPTRPPDIDMQFSPAVQQESSKTAFATDQNTLDSEIDLDFTGMSFAAPVSSEEPSGAAKTTSRGALVAALGLFNQGDFEAAETAFISILQFPDLDDQTAEICSATLLQVYRATGARASFDVVAIEYAQLFGRSAPEWMAADGVADTALPPARFGTSDSSLPVLEGVPPLAWECPPVLSAIDLVALRSLISSASVTVYDWSGLKSIDSEALAGIVDLLRQWCSQTVLLHHKSLSVLLRIAHEATPAGDTKTHPAWWQLRLELLRLKGQEGEFDDVAMEYCVTYEISPPSWTAPRCTLVESS
jgi:hypothetical protein